MSQLKKGVILSYVNIILTNGIGLILTPFIVRTLGSSEFGLYTLLGSLVAQLGMLNFGLNNTVVRFVAKYRVKGEREEQKNFLATIMILYFGISLLVVVIGTYLYFQLDSWFGTSLTALELEKAKPMFVLLIINLAITLPGGTFDAVINAYERFVYTRSLTIVKYVSRVMLVFVLISNYPSAYVLVWIDTILSICFIGFNFYYAYSKLNVRFRLISWNSQLITEILSYSIWIFIYAIAYNFQWQSGQTILGLNYDTVYVAIFGIGIMLGGYYAAFAGAINALLLPKATFMAVNENDSISCTNAVIKVGSINIIILFFVLIGFYLFGMQFIFLWVGPLYAPSWKIALLIMVALTLPLVIGFGNSLLEGMKKNKFKAVLSLITLVLATIIAYFASKRFGMLGIIYPIGGAVIINNIIMLFYFKKVFGFDIILFLKKVFFKPMLFGLIITYFWYNILKFWKIDSWISIVLGIALFALSYIIINYFFVLDSFLKDKLFKIKG